MKKNRPAEPNQLQGERIDEAAVLTLTSGWSVLQYLITPPILGELGGGEKAPPKSKILASSWGGRLSEPTRELCNLGPLPAVLWIAWASGSCLWALQTLGSDSVYSVHLEEENPVRHTGWWLPGEGLGPNAS